MPRKGYPPAVRDRARELTAARAPSREVAAILLAELGVTVDPRTIQRWTADIGGRPDGRFTARADVADEDVTTPLAGGASYARAAEAAGVSKSTAWRRAHRPQPADGQATETN